MFKNHTTQFWDDRYGESGYVYGTEPNQFLAEQQHRLQPGMKALAVGDGEGRNGVWLAQQGLEVLSVDLSATGLQKAQELATQQGVVLKTKQADLTSWNWPVEAFDRVVAIYLHFSPDVRLQMHQAMLRAIAPGGLLILEAFNPGQLEYQREHSSGGPPRLDMLYTPEILQQDFATGEILELTETITELQEGKYHQGQASVIRLIVQKKSQGDKQ